MNVQTPIWVREAVFYQIFPDRFAKSKNLSKPANLESWGSPPNFYGYKGGDLLGIYEHLDYLSDLGINAIYLNPIFCSSASHRYHTSDYFHVDPILGGDDSFFKLLEKAHSMDIRIILDGVFNHCGRGFYQFQHTLENGIYSPYLDWFYFNKKWLKSGRALDAYDQLNKLAKERYHNDSLELYGYMSWWDMPALPKFNTRCKEVKEFIFNVATYWIEHGVDGWRLDVPDEIDDDDFWIEFRKRIKAVNKDAYIVGEIWEEATRWLQGDKFDAVMNYPFTKAVIGYFLNKSRDPLYFTEGNYTNIENLNTLEFTTQLTRLLKLYDNEINLSQLNILVSHDTPRLLTLASSNEKRVRLAYVFLFTYIGSPCIYYGEELGMSGGFDPYCRATINWDKKDWNNKLRNFIKKCIALRRAYKVLQKGLLKFANQKNQVLLYSRELGTECFEIAINVTPQVKSIDLPIHGPSISTYSVHPFSFTLFYNGEKVDF